VIPWFATFMVLKQANNLSNTLEDNIHECGAPIKLINDHAQVEISKEGPGHPPCLFIGSWQSKPHQQHQNPAE